MTKRIYVLLPVSGENKSFYSIYKQHVIRKGFAMRGVCYARSLLCEEFAMQGVCYARSLLCEEFVTQGVCYAMGFDYTISLLLNW